MIIKFRVFKHSTLLFIALNSIILETILSADNEFVNISQNASSTESTLETTTTSSTIGDSSNGVVLSNITDHYRIPENCSIDESCQSTTNKTTTALLTTELALQVTMSTRTSTVENPSLPDIMEKWKYNLSPDEEDTNQKNNLNGTDDDEVKIDAINVDDTSTTIAVVNYTNVNQTRNETNQTMIISKNETRSLPRNIKFSILPSMPCNCDNQVGACDLNCCCDLDCEYVNRDIFDNCTNLQEELSTEEYCPSKLFNSHMFCVVTDNLYSKHYYQDRPPIEEITRIKRVLHRNDIYGWSFPAFETNEDVNFNEEYKIGSKMWLIANQSRLLQFAVPTSVITSKCRSEQPVRYLANVATKCDRYTKILLNEAYCTKDLASPFNMERFYKNLSVVAFPHLFNTSDPDCVNNCVPIIPFICRDDKNVKKCERIANSTDPKPIWWNGTVCRNVVKSVHYEIAHNGTEGIKSANVYFEISDHLVTTTATGSKVHSIRQKFEVTFVWYNQTRYFDKSGHPGYLPRKPIVTGYKRAARTENNRTLIDRIVVSFDENEWLTVFQPNENNDCRDSDIRRRNVLFGQNIYVHCYMEIPKINKSSRPNCQQLQNKIWRIIFGPKMNLSNIYISAFGEPDTENLQKWVPLLSDESMTTRRAVVTSNDSCYSGIITSIRMDILHSISGDYNWPQNTIFAATLTGDNGVISNKGKFATEDSIQIITMVNFYDITHEPIRIFAEPPTYEVRLPPDFFYPFLSSGALSTTNRNINNCYYNYWYVIIFTRVFLKKAFD